MKADGFGWGILDELLMSSLAVVTGRTVLLLLLLLQLGKHFGRFAKGLFKVRK